jgi:hypothetical protein
MPLQGCRQDRKRQHPVRRAAAFHSVLFVKVVGNVFGLVQLLARVRVVEKRDFRFAAEGLELFLEAHSALGQRIDIGIEVEFRQRFPHVPAVRAILRLVELQRLFRLLAVALDHGPARQAYQAGEQRENSLEGVAHEVFLRIGSVQAP